VAVDLNHTIVAVKDPSGSAAWYADLLGLEPPERFGHFWQVSTGNGVNLDFDAVGTAPDARLAHLQHYAFLVSEAEFDEIFGRILERGIDHYADPAGRRKGEINHNDGGRGVYFPDPDGHWLEIITRPYGGGA
jgi:catechol 2,3-dioxygenase-like lactoylglutathione lyase family enzyme